MLRTLLCTCLSVLSVVVLAGKPAPINLSWLTENSDAIVIAKIRSFSVGEVLSRCDISKDEVFYIGSIAEVLKGNVTTLEFCSSKKLIANQSYLLFFDVIDNSTPMLHFLRGAAITRSFIDLTVEWLEIDSVADIAPGTIEVRVEKVMSCPADGEPGDCQLRRARELIDLSLIRGTIMQSEF